MTYEVVPLNSEHLDKLLKGTPLPRLDRRAYFSEGSTAVCLLADGEPVFAGGIVNLQWNRGEGWFLPTRFFYGHVKTCLRSLREYIPRLAHRWGFVRLQATCVSGVSASILRHLGFTYEGTLAKYGPDGETCDIYSRIFEVKS